MSEETHILHNKRCVFIGYLQKRSRKEAVRLLESVGGIHYQKVNAITDVAILGYGYQKINLYRIAQRFEAAGKLTILSESDFYSLFGEE